MSDENFPCYIARKPDCGCIVMAVVDEPRHAKDTAKEIAKCIRDGLTIERVTVGYVRTHELGCKHKDLQAQQATLPGMEAQS